MKEVKLTTGFPTGSGRERQRRANSQRHRRRGKRNMTLYYLLVFVFVLLMGAVLAFTVLFRVESFRIVGASEYTEEQIITCSGLVQGENLLRIDKEGAAARIREELIYIESATVRRKLPNTVEIEIEAAVPYANIEGDAGYYLISASGRILEKGRSLPEEGLLSFTGFDPVDAERGQTLTTEQEQKSALIGDFTEAIAEAGMTGITSVDCTDRLNITAEYEGRVQLVIGSTSELAYKLKIARQLLAEQIGPEEKGTLLLTTASRPSFLPAKAETLPDIPTIPEDSSQSGEGNIG